jgi:hypothetical protein
VQKQETLSGWLRYQAQQRLGVVATGATLPDGTAEQVTDVSYIPGEVLGRIMPNNLPGVITVDCYFNEGYGILPFKAYLPGLSTAMLRQIESTFIKDLRLPIVYRVISARSLDGRGYRAPGGSFTQEEDQFAIRVDERGVVRSLPRSLYPWHKEALARLTGAKPTSEGGWFSSDEFADTDVRKGAETVHAQLGWWNLRDMHTDADKD